MKKVLIMFFVVLISTQISAQKKEDNSFEYLVGQRGLAEYDFDVCWHTLPSNVKLNKFSNGISAPILQVYVFDKKKFIGGKLENSSGLKTEIVNIELREIPKSLIFSVIGRDFNMGFTIEKGAILKEEPDYTVFYTEGVGIWKIYKK